MHVLLISESIAPEAGGGIATSTRRLARSLGEAGAKVSLLTFEASDDLDAAPCLEEDQRDDGILHMIVRPFFTNLRVQVSAKKKATLRRDASVLLRAAVERVRPDLLHSISLNEAGYLAGLAAGATGLPHLAGVRGNDVGRHLFQGDRFEVVRWILERADRIAFVNRHLHRLATGTFPGVAAKSSVIPNGVRLRPLREGEGGGRDAVRRELSAAEDTLVLGHVGALREKKAPEVLLHVLGHLREQAVDARLWVVGSPGSPGDEAAFWSAARERGVADSVRVLGTVPHSRVGRYIEATDIGLFPSLDDGMANGLLETMERARPVVVSDVFDDLVRDGLDGLVCDRFEVGGFCRATERLALDRALHARMGQAARARVGQAFGREAEACAYLALYRRIVASRPRRPGG